jgi:excisionase family DNA binding protein
MDELLTTKQVQDLLKVDRITVYRMLNDGRLKGVKVANQWRFQRAEISRLIGEPTANGDSEKGPMISANEFPAECVEHLQEVFAGILGVGAISVNLNGAELTSPIFSNSFCKLMLSSPNGRKACQESWRKIALRATGNPAFHLCHAGLCYMRSPVKVNEKTVAWMVTGQFLIANHQAEALQDNIKNLAAKYQMDEMELQAASKTIPVLKHTQQEKVQEWAPKVTETVQSMLCERLDLIERLAKISEISSIKTSLK